MAVFDNLSALPESAWLVLAKIVGAVSGSAVSIIYMLPRSRREAAARFIVGVMVGMMFGTTIGLKIANEMGVGDRLSLQEIVLVGSAVSSLCAWWVLGAVVRFVRRYDPATNNGAIAPPKRPSEAMVDNQSPSLKENAR